MLVLENPQTCTENAKHLEIKIVQNILDTGYSHLFKHLKERTIPSHRRRLLDMTAGRDFSSPSLSLLLPSLHSLLPSFPPYSHSVPLPPLPPLSCLSSPSLVSTFTLDPAKRFGGAQCKLSQRVRAEPDRQTLWYFFRLKSAHLFRPPVRSNGRSSVLPVMFLLFFYA